MLEMIFKSKYAEALYQDKGGDVVFVTFNELGTRATGKKFWGDVLFAKLGISSIGVVSSEPNWYPRIDMQVAMTAIRSVIGERKVITYGHSQGGYGALKYSRALGAKIALGFCPQWSIEPDRVSAHDRRFMHFYRDDLENGSFIEADDLCAECYVVYDRREREDRWNAHKISVLPGVDSILCPFGGHEVIRLIAEAGLSTDLVHALTSGVDVKNAVRGLLRASRLNSASYQRNFVRNVDFGRHASITRGVVAKFGKIEKSLYDLRLAVLIQDASSLEEIVLSADDEALIKLNWYYIWKTTREMNTLAAELKIANAILRFKNEDAFARLHAVNSFIKAVLIDEAKSELTAIVDKFGCSKHTDHIMRFAEILELDAIIAEVNIYKKSISKSQGLSNLSGVL